MRWLPSEPLIAALSGLGSSQPCAKHATVPISPSTSAMLPRTRKAMVWLLPTLTTSTPSVAAVRSTDGSKSAPSRAAEPVSATRPTPMDRRKQARRVISAGGSA